jgi:hypothetical protein
LPRDKKKGRGKREKREGRKKRKKKSDAVMI